MTHTTAWTAFNLSPEDFSSQPPITIHKTNVHGMTIIPVANLRAEDGAVNNPYPHGGVRQKTIRKGTLGKYIIW